MKESTIETYLREQVKSIGGKAYKFVSPGNNGVPDRLVCLPGGKMIFVEMKATGKTPTSLQLRQQEKLKALGCWVMVLDSKAAVEWAVEKFKGLMAK